MKFSNYLIFFILFLLKAILIWNNPVNSLDAAFSCTPSFSFLNGNGFYNMFAQNYPSNLFGFVGIPFFAIYKGTYSVHLFFEILKVFFCFQLYKTLTKYGVTRSDLIAFVILVFLDRTINYYGEEAFLSGLILFLFRFFKFFKGRNFIFYFVVLFGLFVLHPVSALVAVSVSIYSYNWQCSKLVRGENRRIIALGLFILTVLVLIYLFYSDFGIAMIKYSAAKFISADYIFDLRFFKTSIPLIIFMFYLVLKYLKITYKEVLLLAVVLLLSLLLKNSDYLVYTIVCLVVFLQTTLRRKRIENYPVYSYKKLLMLIPILFSFLVSVFIPYYNLITRRNHFQTVREIVVQLGKHEIEADSYCFVPTEFLIPLNRFSSTRLVVLGRTSAKPAKGDVVFLCDSSSLNIALSDLEGVEYKRTLLVSPSQGIPSLTKLGKINVGKYGLWKLEIL